MKLYTFIKSSEDSDAGKLSKIIDKYEDFPKTGNRYDMEQYLRWRGEPEKVIELLDRIYDGPYKRHLIEERRAHEALRIRDEIFDLTDCFRDCGDLRPAFKQRPELMLLAAIAGGLYEIADAIKKQ